MLLQLRRETILLTLFVLFAALWRVLPYWFPGLAANWLHNAAPIGALALTAGAFIRPWGVGIGLPVLAMFLADFAIQDVSGEGFYSGIGYTYLGFALVVPLGRWLRGKGFAWAVPVGAVLGSVVFFLVSNFGVWLVSAGCAEAIAPPMCYPGGVEGLGIAYLEGLAFYRHSLLGDLAFTALFFGAMSWSLAKRPALRPAIA